MNENYQVDKDKPGRPYSRLILTAALFVCPTQYETMDKYFGIDALVWARIKRRWLPNPPQDNSSDVPLHKVDARYLERL